MKLNTSNIILIILILLVLTLVVFTVFNFFINNKNISNCDNLGRGDYYKCCLDNIDKSGIEMLSFCYNEDLKR